MQSATRNVLAEPGLLGINAGAALGVVIGTAYAGAQSTLSYLPWAAAGALLGHACVLLIAHSTSHHNTPVRLILAGAALSATFQGISAIILMNQAANYDQFRFWELGALSGVTPEALWVTSPACILGILAACCMVRPLTALRLGDDIARTLGHNPNTLRTCIVFIVALLAGSALALVGPIAFLGLLAPFVARRLAGHRLLHVLLLSGWIGALLLLLADIASRTIAQPFETPASVLIAALGAPLLIWMMRTGQLKPKDNSSC
jgi:iron complex transport system permease protein